MRHVRTKHPETSIAQGNGKTGPKSNLIEPLPKKPKIIKFGRPPKHKRLPNAGQYRSNKPKMPLKKANSVIGALMLWNPKMSPPKVSPAYSLNDSFSHELDMPDRPIVEVLNTNEFQELTVKLKELRAKGKKND